MTAGIAKVELFLGGSWVDVTSFTRQDAPITIKRGRQDEQFAPASATCQLVFNNSDGRFTPRNSAGAYFGNLMRNTQLRVSVTDDSGAYFVRFAGQVPEWPQSWDISQKQVYATITAAGPRRRLQAGARPLRSPFRRAVDALTDLLAYWPMEDGTASTSFGSGLNGANPATVRPAVTFASDDSFAAASALPVLGVPGFTGSNQVDGVVPAYTPGASGQQVRLLVKSATAAGSGGFNVNVFTSGAHFFQFHYDASTGNGTLTMINQSTGLNEGATGTFNVDAYMKVGSRLSLELKQNGTGVDMNVVLLMPGTTSGGSFGVVTLPSATLGMITGVSVGNFGSSPSTTIGHLMVENAITGIFDLVAVLDGYAGETAAQRVTRLSAEEGQTLTVDDSSSSTELLGPQAIDTYLALVDDAARVDGGLSTEAVDSFGLLFRARTDMYSNNAVFDLPYGSWANIQPTDDEAFLQNDVTVTRTGGGSAEAEDTTSIANYGFYPVGYDLSLFTDDQAWYQAGFRLALGTIDAVRWPVLTFNAMDINVSSTRRTKFLALREGDIIEITGLPAFTGSQNSPESIQVAGWTEVIAPFQWWVTIVGTPGTPWNQVLILDDNTFGFLDIDRLG